MRDMTNEAVETLLNELSGMVFQLVNSADVPHKLGGILVIEEFLELKIEANDSMNIRFANCIRILFENSSSSDDTEVLERAASALGHLARAGGGMANELVDFQVGQALEWLDGRSAARRLAAPLILKELAQNTPALFNVHVPKFLDHIWVALRDSKQVIRECALE